MARRIKKEGGGQRQAATADGWAGWRPGRALAGWQWQRGRRHHSAQARPGRREADLTGVTMEQRPGQQQICDGPGASEMGSCAGQLGGRSEQLLREMHVQCCNAMPCVAEKVVAGALCWVGAKELQAVRCTPYSVLSTMVQWYNGTSGRRGQAGNNAQKCTDNNALFSRYLVPSRY